VLPSSFCVDARKAVSPRATHVLSSDLVTMDSLIIIPLRVAQRTLFETRRATAEVSENAGGLNRSLRNIQIVIRSLSRIAQSCRSRSGLPEAARFARPRA
jgi:hypothetical protein